MHGGPRSCQEWCLDSATATLQRSAGFQPRGGMGSLKLRGAGSPRSEDGCLHVQRRSECPANPATSLFPKE